MLEVEVKYQLADTGALRQKLLDAKARLVAERKESDDYLNAPDRDFARTDEALRLRRIGESNFLTYKGPRHDRLTKSRLECEVPCPSGEEAAQSFLKLFEHLGYRAVSSVRKSREIYEIDRGGFTLHICLDNVEQVGSYVELEIVAPEEQYTQARDILFAVAAELGLNQIENRSYLEMLLGRAVVLGGVQ
jgi:adenylate cyclase class 2